MYLRPLTHCTLAGLVALSLAIAGCSNEAKKPPGDGKKAGEKTADNKEAGKGSDSKVSPDTSTTADASKNESADKTPPPAVATKDKSADKTPPPADNSQSAAAPAKKLLLGSPELTAGIPGEGKLTVEQIKAWLDDPKNSDVLQIELPLGLSAGIGQVKGLDANPLTRAKIELGRELYFDGRLSKDGSISCASCHDPEQGYAAHTQFGVGVGGQTGDRNSPVSYNRILSDKQFWDGRAASLEEQAKGPIANPIEMADTHEGAVKTVNGIEGYRIQFEKVFEGPATIDTIAQAIASFERAIVTGPAPFDYNERLRPYTEDVLKDLKSDDPEGYAEYEKFKAEAAANPMSESAKRGREIFFTDKGSCTACHVGPNLSDELYHNLGVGIDPEKPDAFDIGRAKITKDDKDTGAFKTPTIRNVALSAPYMHNGSQKTLEEVVEWYAKGGHPNAHLDAKIKKLELTDQDKKDLVEFMRACTGKFPKVEKGRLPQ
jgi:cytochrome c peroxidase